MPEHTPDAIILAGGLGTRISSVVPDRPKAMADVGGRPFLEFILERLARCGLRRVILASGYMHSSLERHFRNEWRSMEILYCVESRPLGTGGALWKALGLADSEIVLALNGDSFFDIDVSALIERHRSFKADITIALKPMRDFARYGAVETRGRRVTRFHEKRQVKQGLINGGVYLIAHDLPSRFTMPERFSFETDFLEKKVGDVVIGGYVSDGYFIDIGVPEDYARAQLELPRHF